MLTVVRRAVVALVGGVLIAAGSVTPAVAHQQWFVADPQDYPVDGAALLRPGVLLGVVVAVVVTLLGRAAASRLPVPELSAFKPARLLAVLAPWAPRILALHVGLSLIVLSFSGAVLSPTFRAPDRWEALLLVPQIIVGVMLIAGVFVRIAAVAIVLTATGITVASGWESVASTAVLVGSAVFLFVLPPRATEGSRGALDARTLSRAGLALRLGAGVSLIGLAISEKLANPHMARAMLEQVPALNVLAPLGVTPESFALIAGGVELALGLLLISGALPQLIALVTAVPFTATLALFGTAELIGHLPMYGVLLTLLILGSRADSSRALSGSPGIPKLGAAKKAVT
ncbi:hypothetical protein [Sediminivirga luteola]|uniref:hypothetical protein n=1 Tax=Sediminivirga luteola TaxID=1774748 RepID=UPI0016662CE2|nr:hypothetical protein [Sediminivirga luteola]